MSLMQGFRQLPAPGAERPDYTAFTFPAANLTDTSVEEVEIDQALSLQGRQGRDFLGAHVAGLLGLMGTEFLTIAGADHEMIAQIGLASRTGSYGLQDPELIWEKIIQHAAAAGGTDTATVIMNLHVEEMGLGEPELYVAPRLFWRLTNNIDATITADTLAARISSVSRRLSFELFIELLERFADVTLL